MGVAAQLTASQIRKLESFNRFASLVVISVLIVRYRSPAILPKVATNPKIAIVGAGRLGTALAKKLSRAGYSVTEIISSDNPSSIRKAQGLAKSVKAVSISIKTASFDSDLFWLCVPDREIASVGRELAVSPRNWKGKVVFHSSGALSSDELKMLRRRGAKIASVHSLMTFVNGSVPSLSDVPFAIEGDAVALQMARRIVKGLGGEPFSVRKKDKIAYHAWATFCSPLLIAALVTAEQVGQIAGFSSAKARRKMLPIVKQTLANYAALGPTGAFSGPIVRGDAEIVNNHLKILRSVPTARAVYLALAKSAVLHLPVRSRARLGKTLGR
jgi:predicted short-subunit dehydrogenase-like oxidoreductase (DUF2520 family)